MTRDLFGPAPSDTFKRQVSIDKETGNAVGDALSLQIVGKLFKEFARKRLCDS